MEQQVGITPLKRACDRWPGKTGAVGIFGTGIEASAAKLPDSHRAAPESYRGAPQAEAGPAAAVPESTPDLS